MRFWLAATTVGFSGAALAIDTGRPQLMQERRHDVSAPLWLLVPAPPEAPREERAPRPVPLPPLPARGGAPRDLVLQRGAPLALAPISGYNFEGIGLGFLGVPPAPPFGVQGDPPDPEGDVGPGHYLQIVNSSFAVFNKQGTVIYGPAPTRTIFSGFGPPCEAHDDGDGVVLYDPLADRWVISQLAIGRDGPTPFTECIAVSRTPDPTGAWARYAYSYPYFNDYPKLGVWSDAYYATYNMFATSSSDDFKGISLCAFDRAHMLTGEEAPQQCARIPPGVVSGMIPADLDGTLPPPAGAPGMAVGFWYDALVIFRFRVDWKAPNKSNLDPIDVPVAPFSRVCGQSRIGACIPQQGGGVLDALGDRMMFRAAYRNMGDHEVLVANHTIAAAGAAGVRWYEVRDPAGDASLFQQGTYAPDASWRWLGSAAMDRAGNIGLGFSVSGPDRNPAIAWTGRTQADPPGVMGQGETIAFTGAGSLAGAQRWGDYSSLSVDPADDCTFWYTNQYIPARGAQNWHTRILTFQMPGCAEAPDYAIWITPERQTIGRGRNTTFTIATAALRRSAAATPLALSISGLPPSLTAALEQSTIFPGQATILTISAAADAAFDVVPFSLQGAAGSTGQTRTAEVAVVANDFSLSLDPAEARVAADLTTDVLLKTSVLFGSPDPLLFTVGHLRKGVTAAIEPPRIYAGQTATLHLTGANELSASEGRMTIVAESSVASHTIRARVRALGAPRAQISWPVPRTFIRGVEKIIASAVASEGTTLASIDLYVDGKRQQGVSTSYSPAELDWDSRRIGDGMHRLAVRATDAVGGTGDSAPVLVWVQNKGDCGCSSNGGGWETLGLLGLMAALRRRERKK
jgi:hypothetical protein